MSSRSNVCLDFSKMNFHNEDLKKKTANEVFFRFDDFLFGGVLNVCESNTKTS